MPNQTQRFVRVALLEYAEKGTDNIVCWFHICGNVYARKRFEKPDITKGERKGVACEYGRIDIRNGKN